MGYARASAVVVVDRPDAYGKLTTMGIGRDWVASDEDRGLRRFTPDVAADLGWNRYGRLNYIKPLRAIGPAATFAKADMVPSAWSMNGAWEPDGSPKAGNLQYRYLWYYDGTPGAYGYADSVNDYYPNLILWLRRMGKAPDETKPAVCGITFMNGSLPSYAITWAQYTDTDSTIAASLNIAPGTKWTAPMLWGHAPGEQYVTPLAEIGGLSLGSGGEREKDDVFRFEYSDGNLLIGDDFLYGGKWPSNDGTLIDFRMQPGKVRLFAYSQPAMFNLQQITYPSSLTLRPASKFYVPITMQGLAMQQTPQYKLVGTVEDGTGLSVAAEVDTGGEGTRPVVTFTSTGQRRALLYRVQEHRTAVVGAAVSDPVSTADVDNFKIVALSGRIDDTWKNATMQASVENLTPEVSMATLRANGAVYANVTCDDGSTYARQFSGYITPPSKERRGGVPGVTGEFAAEDMVTARLEKKHVLWQSSFGGNGYTTGATPEGNPWSVADAVNHLRLCAGVPDALYAVHASVNALNLGADYYMPCGSMKGEAPLSFRPDTTYAAALDVIVNGRTAPGQVAARRKPMRWGVNENGILFLSGAYEHYAGRYLLRTTERTGTPTSDGWVFDADTATVENWPLQFRSTRSLADFRNLLWLMVGEGRDAAATVLVDEESLSEATSYKFIGDLWSHFEHRPELTSSDHIADIAQKLWEDMVRQNWIIRVTLDHHPEIMPDDECYVTGCSDVEIANGSIFKVTAKDWALTGNLRYTQTVEAVLVEEGA